MSDLYQKIAAKGREMREAQRRYFEASRSNRFQGGELTRAKALEREFDLLLEQEASAPRAQLGLFGEGEE